MVKDKTNEIYTGLIEYLREIYPKLKCGQTYNENEVNFPFVYFFLLDEPTKLTTLSRTEDGVNLVYQIEVYTKDGGNNARKIAHDVRTYMVSQGFLVRNFMPIPSPSNVSRFVGRYERLTV